MNKAGKLLAVYGYKIINVDYLSRKNNVETLAQDYTNLRVFNEFINNVI